MKVLPIGIQSFLSIRTEKDYYYVDKTKYVKILSDNGKYYFLSRPRRFGKSLFLDTLRQAFLGKKELFKGLYLYENWDWNKKYPVVYIDFGGGVINSSNGLKEIINYTLEKNAKHYDVALKESLPINLKFTELITSLYEKCNLPVVVLVDEYDKPILDAIDNIEIAYQNREILKNLYSPLKPLDPYLKLVFLTGVSRFSKVSIFSGLNQLNDITLDKKFATICGYTQSELESIFEDRLEDFDKEQIKTWYNGYSWLGESVYNPFDVMLLFDRKRFAPYWFETGTPTFLLKTIKNQGLYLPDLENLEVGEEIISSIDLEDMPIEALLFQTGYITIKNYNPEDNIYTLSYPNLEVRKSFNNAFLDYVIKNSTLKEKLRINVLHSLRKSDFQKLKDTLSSFFASIPHNWYTKNELYKYEGFYASLVYALFNGAGILSIPE
ncbi:ATP-binding protein, partial [Hydrogenobaculum acidophilum]